MRKVLLPIVAIVGMVMIFFAIRDSGIERPEPLPEPPPAEPLGTDASRACRRAVEQINSRRSSQTGIYVQSMPMKLRYGRQNFRCTGELAYKVPGFFRLLVRHRGTGDEMDVGSNEKIFWFWSKRMDPPVIFYCEHANFSKSNLKTPLHPGWMIRSLNISPIDMEKAKGGSEDETFFYLYEGSVDGSGKPVEFVYTIRKDPPEVAEIRLADESGETVAKTVFSGSRIIMDWLPEDMAMEWDLGKGVYNPRFTKDFWVLPDYERQVEMGY